MPSIIILTQYYPPETGAPQNRLHSLAKYCKRKGHEVYILTALPNYPKNKIFPEYQGRYAVTEILEDITVHRRWLFVSPSRGMVSRLLNYFSFVITSFFALLRMPKSDYIICESPPLFLGWTAVIISRIKGSRLVFNVSDLWPESAEKLNLISNRSLINLAYRLEHWIYRHSSWISGQTRGIVKSIQDRFPEKKVVWFPNGVDVDFFKESQSTINWRNEFNIAETDFIVMYAGIMGHAQGLEVILHAADHLRSFPIRFVMVGDGPEKKTLVNMAHQMNLSQVHFHDNIQKAKIPSLIQLCNAFIVPLKKLELFKGAIPSKLFEPLAMGKPILLGVEGEAKSLFIDEAQGGLFYEPGNAIALANEIKILFDNPELVTKLGTQGQDFVRKNFDRNVIHEQYLSNFI